MIKRSLCVIILFLAFAARYTSAQQVTVTKELLCKKWYPVKYVESNGEIGYPNAKEKKEYLEFKNDSSIESVEDGAKVKGNWTYDNTSGMLTVKQNSSKKEPSEIDLVLIKLTETELVGKSKDEGGNVLTVYFKSEK